MQPTEAIIAHYAPRALVKGVLEALQAAGKDLDALTPDDLAPLDEFHSRGRKATQELAERAALRTGERVLDIGCGIGGPARFLAARFGCQVTGVDLTPEYCRLATLLAVRTGLADRVQFRVADAVALPFEDRSFDVGWMQHCSMNVPDKQRLFAEVGRVLRPGGRLVVYEVVAGSGGEVVMPVPWAHEASTSFLAPAAGLRRTIEDREFRVRDWEDATGEALEWFQKIVERMRTAPPVLGIHLLLGPDMLTMSTNMMRNLEEGRIEIVKAICERQDDAMEPPR